MNIITETPIAIFVKTSKRISVIMTPVEVPTLEKTKFWRSVSSEKGALKQMHLGKHQRTDEGRFRREKADSLVKNLKKEYPALHDVNGNMKLGTLRDSLGVDSLSQALRKLERR